MMNHPMRPKCDWMRLAGRLMLPALALAHGIALPGSTAAERETASVSFTVTNSLPFARPGEPLRCGVPLPRGFAKSVDELTILGPNGTPAPVQMQVTGTYLDGTPRWVLLDWQPNLPAARQIAYQLQKGPRAPIGHQLRFRLENGMAEVDTGVARFRVNTERFRLLDSAVVAGQEFLDPKRDGGVGLQEEKGAWGICGSMTTGAKFEDAGPLTVVLAVRGDLLRKPGEPLASFVCRMHFYAGKSEVRVFQTAGRELPEAIPWNTSG